MSASDPFYTFQPASDEFRDFPIKLQLDDLLPAFSGTPKLSYLISTYNRGGQLSRSLECLARQKFREFEVIVVDHGSTEDLQPVFDIFIPYLQLHTFRLELPHWIACPSRAFKYVLPETKGEVIAISHPEIMLCHDAIGTLYDGVNKPLEDAEYYIGINLGVDPIITIPKEYDEDSWKWVSLKPYFLDKATYPLIDTVDWHTDVHEIRKLPGFMAIGGFTGRPNIWHHTQTKYPWWFVGAAKRDCPIWEDLPISYGHGIIDMWICHYRRIYEIIDVVPHETLCYHQPHQVHATAPRGEQEEKMAKLFETNT